MDLTKEYLSHILSEYYKEEYKEDLRVVVHNFEETPIARGFRSKIDKLNIEYSILKEGKTEDKKLILCKKEYGKGKIMDSSKIENKKEMCDREANTLNLLSAVTNVLPSFYAYDKDHKIIFMEYLGDTVFGRDFRELSDMSKCVLADIAAHQSERPISLATLKKHRNYGEELDVAIEDLLKLNLIREEKTGNNIEYILTPKFSDRFEFRGNGIGIVKKDNYVNQKNTIFNMGLDTIFTFQDKAITSLKINDLLSLNIPKPNRNDYCQKALRKFRSFLRYEGNDLKKKDEQAFFELYSKQIGARLEYESKNIIQNDCHPLNMMFVKGNGNEDRVCITDLFHTSFGPWLSDIVDFLTYLKLFCGLNEFDYEGLVNSSFGRRASLNCKGEDKDSYPTLKATLDIDRTIYALGSLSGILLNYKNKFSKSEQKALETRRMAYKGFLKDTLTNTSPRICSNELKDILMKYLI